MSDFRFTRPDTFPPLIKNLIIINVLVFVAQLVVREPFNLTEWLVMYSYMPESYVQLLDAHLGPRDHQLFKPYQIATHMFAHSPNMIFHIFFNMYALWIFGRILENVWGPQRLLLFYLACGVGAALCHQVIEYIQLDRLARSIQAGEAGIQALEGSVSSVLGASGAVMGVLVAFGYLFPNTNLYLMFIPVPIKAKWLVIGYVAIDLFAGVASVQGDNVARFAHLGGALTGFILVLIWNRTDRRRFY